MHEYGFCVFEKAISEGELAEWRREVDNLFAIAPFLDRNSLLDHQGKLALAAHLVINPWVMTNLLSYSVKGTSQNNGRCPAKVHEPEPPEGGPVSVPYLVSGCLHLLPSFCLYLDTPS